MKPRKAIPRVSKARRARSGVPGKCGIIRLYGAAKTALRLKRLDMDGWHCKNCGIQVHDGLPDWHPQKPHLAHLQSLGAGGSDTISNTKTLCGSCHTGDKAEHNCGGKPLPRKPA